MLASSRGVCGGAGFRGRDKSRPYGQILCSRQTGRPRCLPRFAGEAHGPPAGVRGRAGRADMESAPTWGVCGGGNVPGFEFQRCGGCERPPYGAGETRRPPGKMQFPRCTVGADSISAQFTAARGFGRGMPLSYMPSGDDRPNGIAAAARANVGRDAPILPRGCVRIVSGGRESGEKLGMRNEELGGGYFPGGRNVCPGL